MLNRLNVDGSGEAKIRYLESDYQVIVPGTFVRCAVTGAPIPLDELKYWSFDRQEAYADVEASFEAEKAARG